MDLKLLRSFVVVAEEGNFTKAARRLNISQPPLSQRIINLEEKLNVRLFDRNTRNVELSPAGKALFASAKSLLGQLDLAIENCRQAHRGETGKISIGFTGRASHRLLPEVLRTFRRQFPRVQVEIHGPKATGELQRDLMSGAIDMALCFLPLLNPLISAKPCFNCDFAIVLSASHRLAAAKHIELNSLAEEPFIGYPSGGGFHLRTAMDDICINAGFLPRVLRESESSQVLLCLIAAGNGISILPHELSKSGDIRDVVFKPLDDKKTRLAHGIAWLTGNTNPALLNLIPLMPSM